ncbi:hypothetical protein F5883DRAFT_433399 [Diaporthe sp. PMI_573]|nr:hypothetical protein F5883DRAFT_433399 [Diaporthaceae sp. PMI_573]
MASSSHQPADCTSQSQTSIDPAVDAESAPSEVLNFDCIFRATYPNKGQVGPSGKRRTNTSFSPSTMPRTWIRRWKRLA